MKRGEDKKARAFGASVKTGYLNQYLSILEWFSPRKDIRFGVEDGALFRREREGRTGSISQTRNESGRLKGASKSCPSFPDEQNLAGEIRGIVTNSGKFLNFILTKNGQPNNLMSSVKRVEFYSVHSVCC